MLKKEYISLRSTRCMHREDGVPESSEMYQEVLTFLLRM
jgi:hypothetical protein